jgi:hypothetical protein
MFQCCKAFGLLGEVFNPWAYSVSTANQALATFWACVLLLIKLQQCFGH